MNLLPLDASHHAALDSVLKHWQAHHCGGATIDQVARAYVQPMTKLPSRFSKERVETEYRRFYQLSFLLADMDLLQSQKPILVEGDSALPALVAVYRPRAPWFGTAPRQVALALMEPTHDTRKVL